jgi:hypothetical protein
MDEVEQLVVEVEVGIHGAGSAKEAKDNWGAVPGKGVGLGVRGKLGWSYAIPTKNGNFRPIRLGLIQMYISDFIDFSKVHSQFEFNVVKIGCGLAGFTEEQIKPMFIGSPEWVKLPEGWRS